MPLFTPDGRYLVVRGRLWRASNPALTETDRERYTRALMSARRAIRDALKAGDKAAEKTARLEVHQLKVALGERGPVWWNDHAPDLNRRMIDNTGHRVWWNSVIAIHDLIFALLSERDPDASICPSEVARALTTRGWRELMPLVRDIARELAVAGLVDITQKGKRLSPSDSWSGPIRIMSPTQHP